MKLKIITLIMMLTIFSTAVLATPSITLVAPDNENQTFTHSMIFTWTFTDNATINITQLILDNEVMYTYNPAASSGTKTITLNNIDVGNHQWYIASSNINNETNTSEVRNFDVGIRCPAGDNGMCAVIQGPAAGLAKFIGYLGTPLGILLIPLILLGIMAAIGFAIAFVIKNTIIRED